MRTLFTAEPESAQPTLPEELRAQYHGDLRFPAASRGRPYVIANFVSTLDGVVSFKLPGLSGGGTISGANDCDRFIMGLLRASTDAILVAAGTVNAVSPEHLWLPDFIYPDQKDAYSYYRSTVLKKSEHPLLAIVSGSGNVELDRAVFHSPGIKVVIITTEQGGRRLKAKGLDAFQSTVARPLPGSEGHITPNVILSILKEEFGVGSILTEGGPTFFGQLMSCGVVDELFLTIAPQMAGRIRQHARPALVEGIEFTPDTAPWLNLVSVKKAGDHIYLRYRRTGGPR